MLDELVEKIREHSKHRREGRKTEAQNLEKEIAQDITSLHAEYTKPEKTQKEHFSLYGNFFENPDRPHLICCTPVTATAEEEDRDSFTYLCKYCYTPAPIEAIFSFITLWKEKSIWHDGYNYTVTRSIDENSNFSPNQKAGLQGRFNKAAGVTTKDPQEEKRPATASAQPQSSATDPSSTLVSLIAAIRQNTREHAAWSNDVNESQDELTIQTAKNKKTTLEKQITENIKKILRLPKNAERVKQVKSTLLDQKINVPNADGSPTFLYDYLLEHGQDLELLKATIDLILYWRYFGENAQLKDDSGAPVDRSCYLDMEIARSSIKLNRHIYNPDGLIVDRSTQIKLLERLAGITFRTKIIAHFQHYGRIYRGILGALVTLFILALFSVPGFAPLVFAGLGMSAAMSGALTGAIAWINATVWHTFAGIVASAGIGLAVAFIDRIVGGIVWLGAVCMEIFALPALIFSYVAETSRAMLGRCVSWVKGNHRVLGVLGLIFFGLGFVISAPLSFLFGGLFIGADHVRSTAWIHRSLMPIYDFLAAWGALSQAG